MPLLKDRRLTVLMAAHADRPREWTEAELALVAETTDRCCASIERVCAEAAVRESVAQGGAGSDRPVHRGGAGCRRACRGADAPLLAFYSQQTLAPGATDANRLMAGVEELVQRTVGPDTAVEVATAPDSGPRWWTLISSRTHS